MQCLYCRKYFRTKGDAMKHLEKFHAERLAEEGLDAAQACYLTTHPTLQGTCQCSPGCTEKTEWSYKTGKPYRISPNPECRRRNTERARARLMNARGIDQHTLMSDMEHQKDMRKQKHTSGSYQFKAGGKVDYESQLDKNFLMFCDKIVELPAYAVLEAPESFPYWDPKESVQRQYTPDYYLPDYNLLVEIKEGGAHPNTNPAYIKETKYKVALKDDVMKKQNKYNFIRISGANYGPFLEMLYNITHQQVDDEKPKRAFVVITESACTDEDEDRFDDFIVDHLTNPDNVRLFIGYMEGSRLPKFVAISNSSGMYSWYVSNYVTGEYAEASVLDPIFTDCAYYRLYKYVGSADAIKGMWHLFGNYSVGAETHQMADILEILDASNIFFDDGGSVKNNNQRKSDFILIEEGVPNVPDPT